MNQVSIDNKICSFLLLFTVSILQNGFLKHEVSGLCLDLNGIELFMNTCEMDSSSQKWTFNKYNY